MGAFNYRPTSSSEIVNRKKTYSEQCAIIWDHINSQYSATIVLDKTGRDNKIKIPRVVGEKKNIAQIKLELKNKVDLKGIVLSFGNGSGKGGAKMDAATTAMQENATRFCCEKYVTKLPSIIDIAKIYPEILTDDAWMTTFEMQAKAITTWIGVTSGYNYSRDAGIMPIIENAAKDCGVTVKDNWNPADIYAVRKIKEKDIENDVKEIASMKLSLTDSKLDRLNEYMRGVFKSKDLVGISLKKLGKNVKIEETNVGKAKKLENIIIKPRSVKLLLDLNDRGEFVDGEFTMTLIVNNKEVSLQIRAFSGNQRESTQMDMTGKGEAAKLGKVSSIIAIDPFLRRYALRRRMGTSIPRVGKWEETDIKKYIDEYNDIKDIIIGVERIDFGEDNWENTLRNAIDIEKDNPRTASQLCAKLQCFQWITIFDRIDKRGDLTEFLTVLYYGAKKQYSTAGPFLKVY